MIEIAHIRNGFPTKFGIPRQSGLIDSLRGEVVFAPGFRNPDALRGLEGFSHIWLLWKFSETCRDASNWSPTVRPPRLGGNARMGVFATRSPFRPNPIGLSCVKLEGIELNTPEGPILRVCGADLMDGTPIFDIKPYIPFTDCHPEALGGFTDRTYSESLEVAIPDSVAASVPPELLATIKDILAQDPRPHYQCADEKEYSFSFGENEITFSATGNVFNITGIKKRD